MRHASVVVVLAAVLTTGVPSTSIAQTYPTKPIRIIVGFAPGGNVDTPTRIFAKKFSEVLSVNVLVENRPGAGGNIGADLVAKSQPDGYTLLACGISSHGLNSALFAKLPFDPIKDFAPISMIGTGQSVLIVHPSMPVSTVGDFIEYAKAHAGKVSVASAGIGTSQHLSIELLNSMTSAQLVHVPYKGGAPAISDLLGGQVQAMVSGLPTALPFIRTGKVRALGVTTTKRSLQLPGVPTIAESGVPGFDVTSWLGLCAPSGTATEIIAKLNADLLRALNMPDTQKSLEDQGLDVTPTTALQLADFIKSEVPKWAKVVKDAGITPE